MAVDLGSSAPTRQGLEGCRRRDGQAAGLGALDDGSGQWMLGVRLHRSCEAERLGVSGDFDKHGLALGERAGLVEDDRVHGPSSLEGHPVLDEQPVLGAERGRDGDDERDGQPECMRAGNDQDSRRSDERTLGIAEKPPDHQRDGPRGQGDVEQDCRRPIGQGLGPRCRSLRLRDEAHDPRQGRLVAGGGDLDPERAAGGDRAGDDGVAGLLVTARDSPVMTDSSTSAVPSTTTPSAGTRAPGRTRTMSSTRNWAIGTSSVPSAVTRSAVSGSKAARAERAPWAWAIERISSQWPSSMMVMRVASSHQISTSNRPSVPAQDVTKATTIASEIRVIIPGWRSASSPWAPRMKTSPP